MSAAEQLVEAILDAPSLAEARQILEAALPVGELRQDLTVLMRNYAHSEVDLPRAWLLSARMAPHATALGLHVHGRWLASAGDRVRSIALMQVAVIAYEWYGDTMGAGRVTANLANELYRSGDQSQEALAAAAEAERLFRSSIAPAAEIALCIGKTRMTVQSVYADLQAWERSFATVTSVKELVATIPDPDAPLRLLLADAEISSGMQLEDLFDRFAEANEAYQRAESLLHTLSGELAADQVRLSYFRLWLNRAILALRLGRHGDARLAFDRAANYITIDDHEDWADLQVQRAYQALLIGDSAEARYRLEQVRQKLEKHELPRQQIDLLFYTALLADPGRSSAQLEEAAARYRALGLHLLPIIVQLYQAEGAYATGRYEEAEQILAAVQGELDHYPSPRRRLEIKRIRALYAPEVELETIAALADELRHFHDYAAAADVFGRLGERFERADDLERAATAYGEAMAALDDVRGALRLSLDALTFLQRRRRIYERAFALAAAERPNEALAILERVRAQVMRDELVNEGLQELIARSDFAQLRRLHAELEQARARAFPQEMRSDHHQDAEAMQRIRHELAAVEQRYLAELNRLQAQGVAEVGWIRGEPASLEAIQAALPSASCLISYALVHSLTGSPELWAVVVGASGPPRTVRLAGSAELHMLLNAWQSQPIVTAGGNLAREQVDSVLKLIYRYMIYPLEREIASVHALIIVLDDALPLLPIHAALHPRQGYLVERYVVSYAPSATVLVACTQREQQRTSGTERVVAGWQGDNQMVPLLPHANRELAMLGEQLQTPAQYGPFNAEQILTRSASAQLIHLVCHGVFPRDAHPRFARLILGSEALYAHDFYRTRLRADLLTLNACDTGLHGPGVQGLVSAALVAGASTVVASMWLVNDAAAPALMERFYSYLLNGVGRAEALCLAQRDLLSGAFSHPADWACHFVTGVSTPLPVDQ
jgi:CHAT domain-containing protein